ncbi:MAG: hypothetical protein EGQ00_02285 [Parabacteroides johnsonii]|nr:hypothetical protein [Parabacteroides johnsonii]
MNTEKQFTVAENLIVTVEPNKEHEFLMTTAEVAKGFGITPSALRSCKSYNQEELIENKHFISCVRISDARYKMDAGCESGSYIPNKQTLWTKRGIVRLGFFIKSERAKLFRDWAEDLVIFTTEQAAKAEQLSIWPEPEKRRHNRLTRDRLVDLLADIAKVEDKELRLSIVDKLINNH